MIQVVTLCSIESHFYGKAVKRENHFNTCKRVQIDLIAWFASFFLESEMLKSGSGSIHFYPL